MPLVPADIVSATILVATAAHGSTKGTPSFHHPRLAFLMTLQDLLQPLILCNASCAVRRLYACSPALCCA